MPEILLYHIEPQKTAQIKLLCSPLGITCRTVDPADYGRPIAVLLGLSDSEENRPDTTIDGEMLYLADIQGDLLNILLYQLRKRKLTVALKAVKTETNLGFTSCELFRELSAEREAIQRGATAHNTP